MTALKTKKETRYYEVKIYPESGEPYIVMLTDDNLQGRSLSAWIEENVDFVDHFELMAEAGKANSRFIVREKRKIYLSDADEKNLLKQKYISDAEELIDNHSDEISADFPDDDTLFSIGEALDKLKTKNVDYEKETELLRKFKLLFDQNDDGDLFEDDDLEDSFDEYDYDEESNNYYKKSKKRKSSFYDDYEGEDN